MARGDVPIPNTNEYVDKLRDEAASHGWNFGFDDLIPEDFPKTECDCNECNCKSDVAGAPANPMEDYWATMAAVNKRKQERNYGVEPITVIIERVDGGFSIQFEQVDEVFRQFVRTDLAGVSDALSEVFGYD